MNTGEQVLAYLASYNLKPEGVGKWRCNSPLRTGADSHSFTLKIEADGETGVWNDHSGGEGGTLYGLAKRLGIDTPQRERRQVENSKRAYKTLAEYAALKGVPESVFVKAGWNATPVTYDKRPALEFLTSGGKRYRFLDGKQPAFKSQTGYKACWYGLKIAVDLARKANMPLVLVNGEPSVVVGFHYRMPVCAITGGEQPTIPAELLDELKKTWDGTIILAMDCDDAGRKAAAGKAAILRKVGYTVVVLDLGLSDKGDVADFCKLYTDSALDTLMAMAQDVQAEMTGEKPDDTADLKTLLKQLYDARRFAEGDKAKELPQLLDKIQTEVDKSRLSTLGGAVVPFSKLVDARHKRLDAARANPNPIQGLRSGINKLDEIIGGFVPGRVIVFYGDTGMGKSTLMASVAAALAGQAPGIIVPTESMAGDYLDKIAAYKAGVPYDLIETGTLSDDQYRAMMAVYSWLEERQVDVFDTLNPSSMTVGTVLREGIKNKGYKWLICDSINNLSSLIHDDLYGRTTEAADFLQEAARAGLSVLTTSQVGRNMKGRKNKVPKLDDALGSGRIEQNADVVMGLYNHQYYVDRDEAKPDPKFPPGLTYARCLKHRWRGGSNGKGTFLAFKGGIGMYD